MKLRYNYITFTDDAILQLIIVFYVSIKLTMKMYSGALTKSNHLILNLDLHNPLLQDINHYLKHFCSVLLIPGSYIIRDDDDNILVINSNLAHDDSSSRLQILVEISVVKLLFIDS